MSIIGEGKFSFFHLFILSPGQIIKMTQISRKKSNLIIRATLIDMKDYKDS